MERFYYRQLSAQMWLMLHIAYWRIQKGEFAMQSVKSGVKTSEFYMPAILATLGLLVSLGLLTTPLAENLTSAIAAAVPAVAGLIGAVSAAVEYIRGRALLKASVIEKG
jgi:hypothetical protein